MGQKHRTETREGDILYQSCDSDLGLYPRRQQMQDAIVLAMVNEASSLVDAGVVAKAEDIDLVWGACACVVLRMLMFLSKWME